MHDHYLPGLFAHQSSVEQERLRKSNVLQNVDGVARERQSDRADGQGVAYYTDVQSRFQGVEGLRPALFKTTEQALTHQPFRSLVANTASTCVFAHIRFATQTAIVTTNNRP